MHHALLPSLLVLGLAPVSSGAPAPAGRDPGRDREVILQLERDWLDKQADRSTLERILADDFVHPVSAGLSLDKKQHIAWSVQHPRPADRRVRFEKLEVRLYGDSAIATGIVENTDTRGGDRQRTAFSDVFVYRRGTWQAVNAQETPISTNESDRPRSSTMTTRASGTFDVTANPQPPYETAEGIALGRISIRKTFHGDLQGTSTVEMLSAMTPVKGSAGYVAIERVVGALQGRSGSFVLQHTGTMARGEQSLTVAVVPDSGTGALTGLAGRMGIEIVGGKHLYTFDYALPAAIPDPDAGTGTPRGR
jgi:hypothetical protein